VGFAGGSARSSSSLTVDELSQFVWPERSSDHNWACRHLCESVTMPSTSRVARPTPPLPVRLGRKKKKKKASAALDYGPGRLILATISDCKQRLIAYDMPPQPAYKMQPRENGGAEGFGCPFFWHCKFPPKHGMQCFSPTDGWPCAVVLCVF